jgi:hypothetical protein
MIVVPPRVVLSQAEEFLGQADWTLRRDAEVEIRFESAEDVVQPWALAAICSWALACARHDMTLHVTGLDEAQAVLRMGGAKFLAPRSARRQSQQDGTCGFGRSAQQKTCGFSSPTSSRFSI